jgi:hypothetical protein
MYYLASIELAPTVYEVVKGSLQAKGRIVPGETHTLEVTVKSIRTSASAEITGRVAANRSPDDTRTTGDEDELFMTMTEDGATISRGMPSYSPAPTVIPIP